MHVVIALFFSLLSMCYVASIFHVLAHFRAATFMLQTFQTTSKEFLGGGSEKSAAWTLQPEMGQHMEYAGNVTHREYWKNDAILHAYMAGGKLYGYSFAESQFFHTTKGIYFI